MRREPVVVGVAALDGVLAAVVGLAVAFGWVELTGEQAAALAGVLAAVSALVAGVVRGRVSPMDVPDPVPPVVYENGGGPFGDVVFAPGMDDEVPAEGWGD